MYKKGSTNKIENLVTAKIYVETYVKILFRYTNMSFVCFDG